MKRNVEIKTPIALMANDILKRFRRLQNASIEVIDSMKRIDYYSSKGLMDKVQHERESFLYERIERLRQVYEETK